MKIAVISEPHLGRRQFRKVHNDINIIEQKGYDQWLKSIDRVIEKKPEILFITGDIFDGPNPSSLAIAYAIEGYKKLVTTDIAVVTIGGNHEFSNKNFKEDSHPFKILEKVFPNFDFVYKDYYNLSLSKYNIIALPHQPIEFKDNLEVKTESFNPIFASIMKDINKTDKKNILLAHGVIESWAKMYTNNDNIHDGMRVSNMILDDKFAEEFDYVFIGHNHQHYSEKVKTKGGKNCFRVSPGSILDERNDRDTGPMFMDLEDGELKIDYSGIPSVNTYKIEAQEIDKMMETLTSIKQGHIYLISYAGEWKEIPSELYEEAAKKALYLNIADSGSLDSDTQRRSIKGFWEWIASNDPGMEKEFREVLENRQRKKDV